MKFLQFSLAPRNLRLGFQSFLYWCANWIPFCWNAHLSFIKEFFFITLSNTGCLKLFLWRNVFVIIYGFMIIFSQKMTWIPCRNCFYRMEDDSWFHVKWKIWFFSFFAILYLFEQLGTLVGNNHAHIVRMKNFDLWCWHYDKCFRDFFFLVYGFSIPRLL